MYILIINLGRPADFRPVSGGADTVSRRNENIISLIASLDCIICANTIFGDGALS